MQIGFIFSIMQDRYAQAKALASENKLNQADRVFHQLLGSNPTAAIMTDYANFLIQHRHSPEQALPYLLRVREGKSDEKVQFIAREKESLDDTLRVWLDHAGQVQVSSYVLSAWLLFNLHLAKNEMPQAKALLKEWFANHTSNIADSNLQDSSWYLLGNAALRIQAKQLAWRCFTCVESLPETTKNVFLGLNPDPQIAAITDLDNRRRLVQSKALDHDESRFLEAIVSGSTRETGERREATESIVFAQQQVAPSSQSSRFCSPCCVIS
jgi:hypothetical protein